MADSIYTFDPTAASNTALDSIAYGPNQLYHSNIDNLFRAFAAKHAQYVDDLGAVNTVGGTGNAITVTLASGIAAYATGQHFRFIAGAGNTGATTLNVNSIGAKAVRKISAGSDVALSSGDIAQGETYLVRYSETADSASGAWIIVGAASVAAATTSAAGIVELATQTEAATLTDTSRAVTPDGLFFLGGYTTTATAAGTTTLTVTSTFRQIFTGTSTQTLVLPVTSTLVLGRTFRVINNSTGAVTVQSSGANNILVVPPGGVVEFVCILTSGTSAASWDAKNVRGGLELLTSGTVSSAATLDIVLTSYTGYRGLRFVLSGFIPASAATDLYVRLSTNGGSSYVATGSYNWSMFRCDSGGTLAGAAAASASQISLLGGAVSDTTPSQVVSTIDLLNQTNTSFYPILTHQTAQFGNGGGRPNFAIGGQGLLAAAQDTDAIRFLFSSGNISAGNYAVYGYV